MSKKLPLNDPYHLSVADKMRDVIVYQPINLMPLYIPTKVAAANGK